MQVPLISGVVSTPDGDFLVSYPVNREPVLRDTSLSNGYLGVPPGITQVGSGPGEDRGGINWNGVCYRVMGTTLVSVSRLDGDHARRRRAVAARAPSTTASTT
jgi:hypothetical protein